MGGHPWPGPPAKLPVDPHPAAFLAASPARAIKTSIMTCFARLCVARWCCALRMKEIFHRRLRGDPRSSLRLAVRNQSLCATPPVDGEGQQFMESDAIQFNVNTISI